MLILSATRTFFGFPINKIKGFFRFRLKKDLLATTIQIIGLLVITYGIYLISLELAFIVAGIFAVIIGTILEFSDSE